MDRVLLIVASALANAEAWRHYADTDPTTFRLFAVLACLTAGLLNALPRRRPRP